MSKKSERYAQQQKRHAASCVKRQVALLRKQGKTWMEIANKGDCTRTNIWHICKGKLKNYTIDRIIRIADDLGVRVMVIWQSLLDRGSDISSVKARDLFVGRKKARSATS